jgi:hypothetical protein
MTAFVIYVLIAFVLAAVAAYMYGRIDPEHQDLIWDELSPSVVLFIIFWPVVLPLALIGAAIFFPLRWIYRLGERSREKDSK